MNCGRTEVSGGVAEIIPKASSTIINASTADSLAPPTGPIHQTHQTHPSPVVSVTMPPTTSTSSLLTQSRDALVAANICPLEGETPSTPPAPVTKTLPNLAKEALERLKARQESAEEDSDLSDFKQAKKRKMEESTDDQEVSERLLHLYHISPFLS